MAAPLSVLLDEGGAPAVPFVLGTLLGRAARADVAVAHVRLGHVDLTAVHIERVECRLLLGYLDVEVLAALGRPEGPALERLRRIAAFLDSGRLDVRAAGLLRWQPDFSVFQLPPPDPPVALLGAHYFGSPDANAALTCVLRAPAAVLRARRRFEELWARARDVRDVVRAELRNLGT